MQLGLTENVNFLIRTIQNKLNFHKTQENIEVSDILTQDIKSIDLCLFFIHLAFGKIEVII